MKNQKLIWMAGTVTVVLIAVSIGFLLWQKGAPRRSCLQTAAHLQAALQSGDSAQILASIALPASLQGRTVAEQSEFLLKSLADEISADGLAVLQRDGQFDSLTNLFPAEAQQWAAQAGVPVENCLAFKLQRNGLRAELVLAPDSPYRTSHPTFRVVRCNNVKQMAGTTLSTTN